MMQMKCWVAAVFAAGGVLSGLAGGVTINEIVASNGSSLKTAKGGAGLDWIEIYNGSDVEVDLTGWKLTDNPAKPTKAVAIENPCVIAAGGYQVIFVDKDYAGFTTEEPFARLGLSSSGETLALYDATGACVGGEVVFPALMKDVSYGLKDGVWAYFKKPTPGAVNDDTPCGPPTPKVEFSVAHGYKTEAFDVELSYSDEFGEGLTAGIYYTTNGSSPTTASIPYTGAIRIDRTTVLRAAVPTEGALLQYDTSATYIYLEDVYQQTEDVPPAGFPKSKTRGTGAVEKQTMHYGMRSDIVNGSADDRARLDRSFTNGIDTISIVIDPECLFNDTDGIYVHGYTKENGSWVHASGPKWERPMVLEGISPRATGSDFTIPSGLRLRGGYSRRGNHAKHAFRVLFNEKYGEDKLDCQLFGDEGADSFKKFDLRCSQNYSWAFWGEYSTQDTFVHEVFSRDLQREMGEPYTRSRYYHLFLNGVYWGLYQTQERGDEDFAETYLGGDQDDYDVLNKGEHAPNSGKVYASEGTIDAWSNLWYHAEKEGFGGDYTDNYMKVLGRNPDGTRNPDYPVLLDPTNLIVYIISTHYTADCDTPASMDDAGNVNNIYSLRNRHDDDTGGAHRIGFIHLRHDTEHTFGTENTGDKRTKYSQVTNDVTVYGTVEQLKKDKVTKIVRFGTLDSFNPAELHYRLCENAEYRRIFADLVQKHCLAPDGIMQPDNAWALFQSRMEEVSDAVVAEAARWGSNQTWQTWWDACLECKKFIDNRLPYFIQHYRNRGWFPSIDAPTYDVAAGAVDPGTVVTFSAKAEDAVDGVYVTANGSDPADLAAPSASVAITDFPCVVKARAKKGGEWSALTEVEYTNAAASDWYCLSGAYDGPQTIYPRGEECTVVLDQATVPELILPGKVKYTVIVSNGESRVSAIAGPAAHVALNGDDVGVLRLEGADTLMSVSNLIVKSGALAVGSTGVAVDATPVISLNGRFELNGGRVDLDLAPEGCAKQIFGIRLNNKSVKDADGEDTIFAEVKGGVFTARVGGVNSAALKCSKGSVDAIFRDKNGSPGVDVTLVGPEARFVNFDGKIRIKGGDLRVGVSLAADAPGATAFKSGKEIAISGGAVRVNVPGADSEAFECSNDDGTGAITISGGTLDVVAYDDCFNADQMITVSGGFIYARSLANDCFDSNGSMVLSGGTIIAYATAAGHEAFDVDPMKTESKLSLTTVSTDGHTLTIGNCKIFATGGAGSAWPAGLVAEAPLWAKAGLNSAAYSEKYLSVPVLNDTALLPDLTVGPTCALLVAVPGMTEGTVPTVGEVAPTGGKLYIMPPPSLTECVVTVEDVELNKDGTAPNPVVTVTDFRGTPLVENDDYSVAYPKEVKPGANAVVLTGKGDYTDEVSVTYVVKGYVYTWVGGSEGEWTNPMMWDRQGVGIGDNWPGNGATSADKSKDVVIFTNAVDNVTFR